MASIRLQFACATNRQNPERLGFDSERNTLLSAICGKDGPLTQLKSYSVFGREHNYVGVAYLRGRQVNQEYHLMASGSIGIN